VPQKDLAELRREAVASLGDFVGLVPTTFNNFPTNSTIQAADLDPSGKWAAFALASGTILLCEMPSGKEIARLAGTNDPARVRFNSTSDQLFALFGPTRGTWEQRKSGIRLYVWTRGTDGSWEQTENSLLPEAVGLYSSTAGMFAPTLSLIAPSQEQAASQDWKLRLLDLKTRDFVPGIGLTNVRSATLSPDGQLLATQMVEASGANKPILELWDVKSGRCVQRQQTHLASQGTLKFSPDAKHLSYLSGSGGTIYKLPGLERVSDLKEYFETSAAFANDCIALPVKHQARIHLWSLARAEDIAFLEEPEEASPLAFAPDGSFLLTLASKRPWLYRLDSPEKLSLPAHRDAVTGLAFSQDGARLVSVGKDRVVRVSNAATGGTIWQSDTIPGPGQCVGYSPDGRWLVTGDWETDSVWIWDAYAGKLLLELGGKGIGRTWAAQFSPDGRYLATTGRSGTRIWTIENGEPGETRSNFEVKPFKSASSSGNSLLFSPDSRYLMYEGNGIYLWDFQVAAQPLSMGTGLLWGVQCCSITPDSRQLLFMTGSNVEVVAMDMAAGKRISSFATGETIAPPASIWNFCLSPDGSLLAFDTRSVRGVEIWDPKTGHFLYSLPEENSTVYWLAWSPNSRRLAVSRENGDIAIWNLREIERILAKLSLK
jgi:WD40 repeat protein